MPSKSAVPSGWKTIPADLRCSSPSAVASVTCAVVIANRRSGAGSATFLLLPPSRASRNPTPQSLGGALQLRLELLQALDALLHRRVSREDALDRALDARRDDEEGVHALGLAQVPRGDRLHR